MNLEIEIVGKHFINLGKRLIMVSDNPTVDEIETAMVRWALRLTGMDWTCLMCTWKQGVCRASLMLDRKEIP